MGPQSFFVAFFVRGKVQKKLWLVVCIWLAACGHNPSLIERTELADQIANRRDWIRISIAAKPFELVAYLPKSSRQENSLTIYIEGDGFAWISETQPSNNPTPLNPLALRLALSHTEGNVAYLARPCQYVDAELQKCASRYWTDSRFAPEIINSANIAIDVLKRQFGAADLTLIGYSGGAAIASLLAARRDDVRRLVTVAGNLDHEDWTRFHRIHPLTGSLNPVDEIDALRHVEQIHFAGGVDTVMPPELIGRFLKHFSENSAPKALYVIPGFDHGCCWADDWFRLWQLAATGKMQSKNLVDEPK